MDLVRRKARDAVRVGKRRDRRVYGKGDVGKGHVRELQPALFARREGAADGAVGPARGPVQRLSLFRRVYCAGEPGAGRDEREYRAGVPPGRAQRGAVKPSGQLSPSDFRDSITTPQSGIPTRTAK